MSAVRARTAKARKSGRAGRPGRAGGSRDETVAAAEFKAQCLSLFNRVRETGIEYIVTKHGTPVARVVPYGEPRVGPGLFGSMKGTVLRYERPFDPIDGDYDINRD